MAQAAALAQSWPDLPTSRQRRILSTMISRIDIDLEAVTLQLLPAKLGVLLTAWEDLDCADAGEHELAGRTLPLTVAVRLRRIEKSGRLFVHDASAAAAQLNEPLIRLLVRAHQLQQALLHGAQGSLGAMAAGADLSDNRTARLIRLSWLAPDITQAILRGQQPPSLTADRLSRMARIPMDWSAQRALLGFG